MQNIMTPSLRDPFVDEPSTVGDKIADTATSVKENITGFGRKAADKIDENMASAASGLDKAAETLHGRADNLPGVEKMTSLAHTTADKLSATAGYLREHDVATIKKDLTALVKDHPGPSLLVAGVLGFLLGRALLGRRD